MSNGQQANNAMQQALVDHVANAMNSSRSTTTRQLIFACILMLAGAAVGVISVELKQTAVVASFGTALIGAGATLLPAGASATANAELHGALSQLAILAGTPQATVNPPAATNPPEVTTPAEAPASIAATNGPAPADAVLSAVAADAADAAALQAEQPN